MWPRNDFVHLLTTFDRLAQSCTVTFDRFGYRFQEYKENVLHSIHSRQLLSFCKLSMEQQKFANSYSSQSSIFLTSPHKKHKQETTSTYKHCDVIFVISNNSICKWNQLDKVFLLPPTSKHRSSKQMNLLPNNGILFKKNKLRFKLKSLTQFIVIF